MKQLTYLAIPYTWNPNKSFEIVNKIAAKLMNEGKIILSPISHSHPIADYMDESLRTSQEFWMNQDEVLLSKCDEITIVVINDDWQMIEESKGVQEEIRIANELLIPITYYNYYE